MNEKLLKVSEVAKILKISDDHVRKLLFCGELEGYDFGINKPLYRITEDSVMQYKEQVRS